MQHELFNDTDLGDSRGPLTRKFDLGATVTVERMEEYGHPLDDFKKIELIKQAVSGCKHPLVRHCLEMIGVKLARLTHDYTHLDSMKDIAGYARCICLVLDEEQARRVPGTFERLYGKEGLPKMEVADAK